MNWLKSNIKKIILGIISIIFILIILYVGFVGYLLVEEAKEKAQKDKVEMTIKYDAEVCSKEFPLLFTVKNNSDRTINSINFYVDIYRKGYSNNISDFTIYETDKIIALNEVFRNCWKYELSSRYEQYNDPNNLEFKFRNKSIRLQE